MPARFLLEFAAKDLIAPTAIRTTLVMSGAVGFAAAVAVAGFGFVRGVERAERAVVLDDPLVYCLFADDRSAVDLGFGGNLDPADPGRVADVLAREVGPGAVRGVYPFRRALLSTDRVDLPGRTLAVGADPDPLPESRPVAWGRWFTSPADEGVVLTPPGLFQLGLGPDARPGELDVVVRKVPVRVKVLGATAKPLPNTAVTFLIPEEYYLRLHRRAHPDPAVESVRSGPIPDEWMDAGRPRAPVTAAARLQFPTAEFAAKSRLQGSGLVLAVDTTPPPTGGERPKLKVSEWRRRLEEVRRAAAAARLPDSEDFARPRYEVGPQTEGDAAPPEAGVYNGLAAYLTRSEDLAPAAAVMGRYGMAAGDTLRVDTRAVEQLTKVGQQADRYRTAMGWVVGLTAAVFVVLVWFLFLLRAEQQVAEVGMLKAMGMRRLWSLALLQGAMVGAAGGVFGALAGIPLTGPLLDWYSPGAAAGPPTWDLAAAAAAAAVLAGSAASWVANLRASGMSPATAIRSAI